MTVYVKNASGKKVIIGPGVYVPPPINVNSTAVEVRVPDDANTQTIFISPEYVAGAWNSGIINGTFGLIWIFNEINLDLVNTTRQPIDSNYQVVSETAYLGSGQLAVSWTAATTPDPDPTPFFNESTGEFESRPPLDRGAPGISWEEPGKMKLVFGFDPWTWSGGILTIQPLTAPGVGVMITFVINADLDPDTGDHYVQPTTYEYFWNSGG